MFLTVAICTFRRPALLETTLASLRACVRTPEFASIFAPVPPGSAIPARAWEVLVVDNAAEPEVRELVQRWTSALPVRYVAEPMTGTSHARNRAVAEAQAPIILFTDDDVTFAPTWLARLAATIVAQPQCAFWGGRVEPVWPANLAKPVWFEEGACPMLGDTIVQYRKGEVGRAFDPNSDPPFYTANLALRIEAVRAVGGFDTSVGHRGNMRMGMEDSLLVQALVRKGYPGWYAGDAVVHHPVPPERLTQAYALDFARRQARLSVWMTRRETPDQRAPRWLWRACLGGIARGCWRRFVGPGAARRFAGRMERTYNLARLNCLLHRNT